MGQGLLHTLLFLVDRIMLGRHDPDSLAAMQIGGPLVWAVFSTLYALNVGPVALVGRAVGAGDAALATAATRGAMALGLVVGLFAGALGLLLIQPLLLLFPNAGPDVHAEASAYLLAVLPGLPFVLLSLTGAAVLSAAGDTRTPFLISAVGNALNIGVNALLIPQLGAMGAGIGSTAAVVLQSLFLIHWLRGRSRVLSLEGRGGERAALRRVLEVSMPAVAERIVQHIGFYGFVVMVGWLGPAAMAANQSLVSLESIAFLSADGIGIAAAAVVAQKLGAGESETASRGGWIALRLSLAWMVIIGATFALVPETLMSIFITDEDIVALGVRCLFVAAVAQPFMGSAIVLAQALRGAGETRLPFMSMVVCGLGVRLAATWYFAFALDYGLVGVWIGSTLDWMCRFAILGGAFYRGTWRSKTL
ncbi:MAG: MATE family efflux transporter [Myxococcota bacterium]